MWCELSYDNTFIICLALNLFSRTLPSILNLIIITVLNENKSKFVTRNMKKSNKYESEKFENWHENTTQNNFISINL